MRQMPVSHVLTIHHPVMIDDSGGESWNQMVLQ